MGQTGENPCVLQRRRASQLSAPMGTSAPPTAAAGNPVPFYISLILGCWGGKGRLRCYLKTSLQIVGGGDDRVFQPNGHPVGAAL